MKKYILIIFLLGICSFDGYLHYRQQQTILELEWALGLTTIQKDMLLLALKRCK